jgi:thiol-disulfide isomerase/thioredoxin
VSFSARGHLEGATGWLNSPPLTDDALQGKVVVVNFCTYTCINWLRQLPYVRAWAERYRDHGLVVIGAHTPEFDFERDPENVRTALEAMRIPYPIAIDSSYAIWEAFGNRYWPALYFVDPTGRIRHEHFGEGSYSQSELTIRELLEETGADDLGAPVDEVAGDGIEAAADWGSLESPETYLGYDQTQRFGSPGGFTRKRPHVYEAPAQLDLNQWALAGGWTAEPHAVFSNDAASRISFRFHARDVHLVMAPQDGAVPFRVLVDGQPPNGGDVDENGNGTADQQRTYQLVRQPGPISERTFEITFDAPGVGAYCFTFG